MVDIAQTYICLKMLADIDFILCINSSGVHAASVYVIAFTCEALFYVFKSR